MDCTDARTAISARLDGEDLPRDASVLHAHLAGCADCRAWETEASRLHRRTRVGTAPVVLDLTARVLAATATTSGSPASPDLALRVGLALVALVQIGIAAPALLLGEDAGLPAHTARHLGSFAVALGIGFLVAAWRPGLAAGLLPVAAALAALIVVTSILDVVSGRAAATNETAHTTELVGLAGLWLVSRSIRPGPEVSVA